MFRIDLAAAARRTAGRPGAEGARIGPWIPGIALLAIWVVALAATHFFLARRAERHSQEAAALEAAVTEARRELAEISGKRRELLGVGRAEIYWSDQLRALSRRIDDKMWIERLAVAAPSEGASSPELVIEGGVLSGGNETNLDRIAAFVRALEDDERFRNAFGPVRLQSVRRTGSDLLSLKFSLRAAVRSGPP
jgi:Tfp pilus assembly protein PilN